MVVQWFVPVLFGEVILGDHLDVRVIDIDTYRPAKGDCNGSIASKECPPDAFPQALVGPTQLRAFDTVSMLACTTVIL